MSLGTRSGVIDRVLECSRGMFHVVVGVKRAYASGIKFQQAFCAFIQLVEWEMKLCNFETVAYQPK